MEVAITRVVIGFRVISSCVRSGDMRVVEKPGSQVLSTGLYGRLRGIVGSERGLISRDREWVVS